MAEDEGPRPHSIVEVVDRFISADEKRRVEVGRRHDGYFSFGEMTELYTELYDDYSGRHYWSGTYGSGLYATREEALRDAKIEIRWLRESLTHTPL